MATRFRGYLSLSSLTFAAIMAACGSDPTVDPDAATPEAGQFEEEAEALEAPQHAPVADARLETEILMKFVADREVDARNFTVTAAAGVVTISPATDVSHEEKQRALRIAQAVDGATTVQIEGEAPAPAAYDEDAQAVANAAEAVAADAPLQDLAPEDPDAQPGDPSPSVEQALAPPEQIATPTAPQEEAQVEQQAEEVEEEPGDLRPYTVRRGESLSVIASRQLGDGSRWTEVYEMNRQTIGPNPDGLREGMTIMLPPRR